MNQFQFQTVPNIIAGLGSIQELKTILSQHDYQKALLVTDAGMIQHLLHLPILEIFNQIGLEYIIYSDIQADPPEHIVLEAVDFAKQEKIDIIIGFGGGSSMDVAKIIALLAHPQQQQNLGEIYGVNQAKAPRLPLILIPTTAGTGSEVTPISIVTTGATTKMGVVSPILYADVAILDATFTQGLPAHITAATGIDAMVHAIEAYTSNIKKNFYADMLAKNALQLLNHNLAKVLKNGADLEARQNMLVGSMLAGQAFANAPVGAVHALAYPLGGHFHLSHGHTNALVLVEVLKFNAPKAKQHYAELMQLLDPHSTGCTDGLCDLFIDHMQNHLDQSGLTLKLKDLDIAEAKLPQLAKDAMLQTRLLQNNPREMTEQDALQIYQAIYA
ncbi:MULTISPECIES: iron-containing alcohol dehydrogenase [unclassified Acinetobacter]|uniref:iron-containing alcohol dehydrogenase n=1 Tax=unclassified Acinetobacter TaxID=196816 RepID=UPI002449A410|nr:MULTISPECIES: iron-containing alcohol dehydrogenase [unclassified Acinetobacter]MDH0032063.1 iron-containing alcohol dehydrogenase [Acinetobacter sp. GD04021]MDH0887719.1 iron-containing alcohol dehydrogenase [Acinetobacter sp. GD03873]MDH1084067.1 iron-containing alcohol dehydrogenase [Acinetobacter sp. GD03983]MDH2191006.1 iron-containing alcohol dehydrogenase [Acinetobacter sp. GD03645]MDH2204579.1 iron-containing alcohol dehydrogenase [Acinetobacter sp. GD03647]